MGQHQRQSNLETNQCETAGDADLSSLPSLFKKTKRKKGLSQFQKVCVSLTFTGERKK